MDPKLWRKIEAFTEREEKVQVSPSQYAVRRVKEPVECWLYIGPPKE